MAFAGIPNESDRANLIAYLVANSWLKKWIIKHIFMKNYHKLKLYK